MKKHTYRILSILLLVVMVFNMGCAKEGSEEGTEKVSVLDPDNPVTVTIWNYYNGDQLQAFEKLVEEYNSTVGHKNGVTVISESQGDVNTLADSLLDAVDGKAGAKEVPVLASVYPETAYILDKKERLAAFDSYFTEAELEKYIGDFLSEGRFNEKNELLQFPIIKSTEVFSVNETDWEKFEKATNISIDDIKTKEDLSAAAKKYYEWTDSLTPKVKNDGKALYGRDSIGNYIYSGCSQLGHEIFTIENGKVSVDLDRETFKILWDNYYIPMINGYFGAYGNFRSEDAKTGKILALTSSTSSVSYLPETVTLKHDKTHKISMQIREALPFKDAKSNVAVQQGASYCMMKCSAGQQEGAVDFIKWFTESNRNLNFAIQSGYSPVTKAANNVKTITEFYKGDTSNAKGKNVLAALTKSAEIFAGGKTCSAKPFEGSKDLRAMLQSMLEERAKTDRKKVEKKMAAGASHEQAVSKYSTDKYFDRWFDNVSAKVKGLVES